MLKKRQRVLFHYNMEKLGFLSEDVLLNVTNSRPSTHGTGEKKTN